MALVAVLTLGLVGVIVVRAQSTGPNGPDTPAGFDDSADIAGPLMGRQIGEPGSARAVGQPDEQSGALAFAISDVGDLADKISQSPVLEEAAAVRVADLRQAGRASRDICEGVPRPTESEDIIDTRAFRIVDADAVVDVRITEFDEPATVDRVLQASRSAWDACDGKAHQDRGTVERSVLSFVSLSGTNGVNLQSRLLDPSGALESSSQTLAVPAGDVLIEVRMISNGELSTSVDPVQILDDVESLL